MATVIPQVVYKDGNCIRTALFAINNTTTGDTADLATWFQSVKRAGIVSATGTTIAAIATIASGALATPTLVTIPAGPAGDGVWLLVVGIAVEPLTPTL